jgi:alkylation response protein AidB-like acyl-CoA dehydrogenase
VIDWTADQVALRDGLSRWYDVLSADHVEQDAEGVFNWDKWKAVQRSGLLGLPFAEEYGGLDQDVLTTMYVLEGLGEGCRDGGLSFSITTTLCSTGVPLQRFGNAALREKYLPRICSGEAIGAHAISEPRGGSDALQMLTRAERDGDDFVLNGSKTFVSNAPIADLLMVYARTHPG